MKTTIPKLRQTIRKLIKESIPIYDGRKETPGPLEVEKWARSKGMECYDYRGWPYPTICEITHPRNPELFFVVRAHRNRNNFIKLNVYEYTEEKPRGNPPEYYIKDANIHSIDTLEKTFNQWWRDGEIHQVSK